jgi:dipeptidyl aminopeptidase/acylaminoacyl peptidase
MVAWLQPKKLARSEVIELEARDFWEYNRDAQILAASGYLVLQVNFRGSTGYGIAFQEASNRQWGKAVQDDITDATLWVVEQGYADRACG